MDRHKEGVEAAMKNFRLGCSPLREDVEKAIRDYHEKSFRRQDDAPVPSVKATRQRLVGPWEDINED